MSELIPTDTQSGLVPRPLPVDPRQEVDLWWGIYSPRTMLPSFLVSIVLTGLIVWGSRNYLEKGQVQMAILSSSAVVWIVQTWRWGRRCLGNTFRLTSRRVTQEWGVLARRYARVELAAIREVQVRVGFPESLLGVGRVHLVVDGAAGKSMTLHGVYDPQAAADRIRRAVQRARAAA